MPCTLQGTCRATSQSGSCRLPRGSTKGALSGKKTSHTKITPYLTDCSCYHQEEPGSQHNCFPFLILALKHAFLQCAFQTSTLVSREMPKKCWESCCCCVLQLSGNVQLPQGTTHLCDCLLGQTKPQEQLMAITSSPLFLLGYDGKNCALLQFSRLAEGPAGAEPMGTGL